MAAGRLCTGSGAGSAGASGGGGGGSLFSAFAA